MVYVVFEGSLWVLGLTGLEVTIGGIRRSVLTSGSSKVGLSCDSKISGICTSSAILSPIEVEAESLDLSWSTWAFRKVDTS